MNTTKSFGPFLRSAHLYLREVRLSDVEGNYHRWMNDPEVTRYLESRFRPHSADSLREYIVARQKDQQTLFLAIVLENGDRHIGNIKLGPIDWIHRVGDIGILIGEKDCWGKGYAREAITALARFAFDTLNLHRLTASCYAVNEGSARTFQSVGFSIEGVRRGHYFCAGGWVDAVLLGLLRDELVSGP